MGREDRRRMRAEQASVELGHEPLQMEHVGPACPQRGEPQRMLGELERQPRPRAAEETRRQRIEELATHVAVGARRLAEAEARRYELDVGAGPRERSGELVIVRRRERRRIGENDPHERP